MRCGILRHPPSHLAAWGTAWGNNHRQSPGGLDSAESARAVVEGAGQDNTDGATGASFRQGVEEEIHRAVRVGAMRIFDQLGASAPAEPQN